MDIDFITSNKIKLNIAKEVLNKYNINLKQRKFEFREIQSINLVEVALDKAKQVLSKTDRKFIIDDSGLYIKALNGFPGALLKTVHKTLGDEKLIKLMENEKNRNALFVNVLAFGDPKTRKLRTFLTEYPGMIARRAEGSRNIGWAIDRIFIPEYSNKTLAQLDDEEWKVFWKKFKNRLHYEKFGRWMNQIY